MAFKDWLPWNAVPNAIDNILGAVDKYKDIFNGIQYNESGSGRKFNPPASAKDYAVPKNTGEEDLGDTTFVSPGNSGADVNYNSFTVPTDTYGEWTPYLEYLKEQSDANTAWNEMMAAQQNDWQRETNRIMMDFNASEAAKNREWQYMMSSTAHQREVEDLKAAGLNPILSATGGNGAAVTSGATASGATSAGVKPEKDTAFVAGLLNFVNNIMGYATSTATAGISAGAVMGAANISADATRYASDNSYLSAQNNGSTPWSLLRRMADQGFGSARDTFSNGISNLPKWMQNIMSFYDVYRKSK